MRVVQRTMQLLADNPRIGRSCDELRLGYRKRPSGSHVIFYRVSKVGMDVVRVLHARMDFDQHL